MSGASCCCNNYSVAVALREKSDGGDHQPDHTRRIKSHYKISQRVGADGVLIKLVEWKLRRIRRTHTMSEEPKELFQSLTLRNARTGNSSVTAVLVAN